jgi:hypothetical protein
VVIGGRYGNLSLLEQFSVKSCDERGFVANSMPDGVVICGKRLQPITISVFRVRLQKPAVFAVFIRQSNRRSTTARRSVTEAEWLVCEDPPKMLRSLQGLASDRKARLFVCADCRS